MDLAKTYKSIAEKLCPNAVITVDRFHVSKLLHEELNQGRISQKKTAESLKAEERKKILGSLKGCKYILLKRSENLSEPQKIRLIKLKESSMALQI